jgi:Flp pilus assembly protein TadG
MVRLSVLHLRREFRPAADSPRPTAAVRERGSVTAETAIVLPAVVAVLAMLLAGATAGSTQLQLEKAAQTAARQLARGESGADAASAVRRIAGSRAVLASGNAGGWVSVEVSTAVPGPWAGAGGWTLTADASAPAESHSGLGTGP